MKIPLDIADQRIVKALSHPLRARILAHLDEAEASPVELAKQLGEALPTVSYHVRILADLGLIKLVRETPRRGALEHHYRSKPRPKPQPAQWATLPRSARQAAARGAARELGEALEAGARAGGFDRTGASITTDLVRVDAQGWDDLASELSSTRKRVQAIAGKSARRLEQTGGDPVEAGVMMSLLEIAAQGDDPARAPRAPKAKRARASSRRAGPA